MHLPRQYLKGQLKAPPEFQLPRLWQTIKCGYSQETFCPPVSAPINVTILERELSHHPNRDFSNSLINALRFGTHVGYTCPEKYRVSRNLVSAVQHLEVVSSNLTKQISLGRVAEPFPSPLLSHIQCHLLGVVPKKTFLRLPHYLPFILSGGGQYY